MTTASSAQDCRLCSTLEPDLHVVGEAENSERALR